MINHRCPKLSAWNYNQKKDGFVLDSMGAIERGLEVFDSYGNKCNAKFFVNYGFLEDIPDSFEYLFTYHLETGSPLYEEKKKLLQGKSELYRLLLSSDYETETVIKGLRLLVVDNQSDLGLVKVGFLNQAGLEMVELPSYTDIRPLSIHNEKAVLTELKRLCQQQLLRYTTSADDDSSILAAATDMSYNAEICVRYRLGEKRLLEAGTRMVDAVLPLFDLTTKEVALRADHHPCSKYREYIQTVVVPLIDRQRLLDGLSR